MLSQLGVGEIVFGIAIVFLLFGSKKIPAIARGLGEGIRNFKSGVKGPEQIEKPREPGEKSPGSEGD